MHITGCHQIGDDIGDESGHEDWRNIAKHAIAGRAVSTCIAARDCRFDCGDECGPEQDPHTPERQCLVYELAPEKRISLLIEVRLITERVTDDRAKNADCDETPFPFPLREVAFRQQGCHEVHACPASKCKTQQRLRRRRAQEP